MGKVCSCMKKRVEKYELEDEKNKDDSEINPQTVYAEPVKLRSLVSSQESSSSEQKEEDETHKQLELTLDTRLQVLLTKFESSKESYNTRKYEYNKKALVELPSVNSLQEFFHDKIGSNIDTFKGWYSVTTMTFTSINPIYTNNTILKTEVVTKRINEFDNTVYYKGEVNDEGEPHGVGLMIIPFKKIEEAYYKNGRVCGEAKGIFYTNDSGEIKFSLFGKCTLLQGIGKNGYWQSLTENGHVKQEGYWKENIGFGEGKISYENPRKYGKKIARGEILWY